VRRTVTHVRFDAIEPLLQAKQGGFLGRPMSRLNDFDPEGYCFRGLHPDVFVGTASDRYAGWIGQIYSEDKYQGRIISRNRKVGGKSFKEMVLPVDSLGEYFDHFQVLEIDYTFYQLLLDQHGTPTQSYHVLKSYREHLTADDFLILKVPQVVFAQRIRHGSGYMPNDTYLNPEVFAHRFYLPATDLLGSHLRGFVFEQEYQRKDDRAPASELAEALAGFFEAVPGDQRYHIEFRTESYLNKAVFAILKEFGIGQVLSHWTWLPALSVQFAKSGHCFFNSGKQGIVRLMTPLGTRYEDAYARAFPFNQLVEGMLQPRMIHETAELMNEGIRQNVRMNIIINNRAGGNAPRIARLIADRFLSERSSTT
jgi:uncharacterized protein YecE (DUF72 family)